MRSLSLSLVIAALLTQAAGGQGVPSPSGDLVAEGATLELLFTRTAEISGGLTEGPAVAPDGNIYFSDIPSGAEPGMILRFDPQSMTTSTFARPSHKSNGLMFDAQGRLLACEGADHGGRCLASWDVAAGDRQVIVDRFEGRRLNSPNDLCLDAAGRIYFTDPRYVGHETRELPMQAVYRVDPDGSLQLVTDQVNKPNGIIISPDGKKLYVAEHDNGTDRIEPGAPPPAQGEMKIYAFDLGDDGSVGTRRVLVDFGELKGCDGMCVDRQGNVYLAVRDASRPGVMVVDPDGREVAFIPTGPPDQDPLTVVGLPSNVVFGIGQEASRLYITVDTSLYRIGMNSRGYHVQYDEAAGGIRAPRP